MRCDKQELFHPRAECENVPHNPGSACLDERDYGRNLQTNKGLMATAAALLADLIKEAFCASSPAQRSVNDGGCSPHQHHVIGRIPPS